MDSKDVVVEGLGRIRGLLGMSLKGLTAEQLAFRPSEQANSIAWLAWHLTRVQDHHLSALAGREQAWVADGWHARFGKPADPNDTGQRSVAYVQTLSAADLDRVLNEPQYNPLPTVGVRLVSVCSDNLQHAGQIAYLRGLIEDKRWFPA